MLKVWFSIYQFKFKKSEVVNENISVYINVQYFL